MVTSDILLSITKNIFVLSCLTGALPGPGPGAAAGLHAVPGAGLGVEVAVLTSLGPALTRRVTLTRDTGYILIIIIIIIITWQNSWHWILVMVRVLVSQCTISCLLVCDSLDKYQNDLLCIMLST